MKREVTICDLCSDKESEDLEDYNVADEKCELCKKDVCNNCYEEIEFGNSDTTIFNIYCCNDCIEETSLEKKEDKAVIKEVKNILLNHFKKKVLTANLK